jgi:hypothetical protein
MEICQWLKADNSATSRSQLKNERSCAHMALKDSFAITFTVYFNTNQDEEHEMLLGTKDKNNVFYDISGLALLFFRNAAAMNWLHGEVDPVWLRSTPGVPSRNMEN